MDAPKVTPLSSLQTGDIFKFGQARKKKQMAGEHTPLWKVEEVGAASYKVVSAEPLRATTGKQFARVPMLFSAATLVIRHE